MTAESHSEISMSVRTQVAELGNRLDNIEGNLRPRSEGLLGSFESSSSNPNTRFDQLEVKIRSARDAADGKMDALAHSIGQLREMIEAERRQVRLHYEILATSLRARDARDQLRGADTVVMQLGNKLIAADLYHDGNAWASDYSLWGYSLGQIEGLLHQWQGDKHQQFLKVQYYEYDGEDRRAPTHIIADDDRNVTKFKQVCIAHDRYLQAREGIFNYFASKASDLPP
jgi:hypothetical protein